MIHIPLEALLSYRLHLDVERLHLVLCGRKECTGHRVARDPPFCCFCCSSRRLCSELMCLRGWSVLLEERWLRVRWMFDARSEGRSQGNRVLYCRADLLQSQKVDQKGTGFHGMDGIIAEYVDWVCDRGPGVRCWWKKFGRKWKEIAANCGLHVMWRLSTASVVVQSLI